MKVLIAPDSYKGSLTASEVADIIGKNIVLPAKSEVIKLPMSDGGEGFSETVTTACGGETVTVKVQNPHGKLINASYGIIKNKGKTAIIDVASASGLILISKFDRDPVTASTFGTGQMILDAVNRGTGTAETVAAAAAPHQLITGIFHGAHDGEAFGHFVFFAHQVYINHCYSSVIGAVDQYSAGSSPSLSKRNTGPSLQTY